MTRHLRGFGFDLRSAARTITRSPARVLAPVVLLALALATLAVMVSAVDRVLLHPLPFSEPHRLVRVWETHAARGAREHPVAPAKFLEWQAAQEALTLAAWIPQSRLATVAGMTVQVDVARVSDNLFSIVGIRPAQGRVLAEEDAAGETTATAVIAASLADRLGLTVGGALPLDGDPHRIVGIVPDTMAFPERTDVWIPLRIDNWRSRGARMLHVIGRVAAGSSVASATAVLETVARRAAATNADTDAGWTVGLLRLDRYLNGHLAGALLFLLALAGLVVIVAAANVAVLFASRAVERRTDLAVQLALGAPLARLVRQAACEGLLVGLAAGAAALLLAPSALWLVRDVVAAGEPRLASVRLGPFAALTTVSAAATAAATAAVLSLWSARRLDLEATLRGQRDGGLAPGWNSALVAVQAALAVLVVTATVTLVVAFRNTTHVPLGLDAADVVTARVALPAGRFARDHARVVLHDTLVAGLAGDARIRSAALSNALPLASTISPFNLFMEGTGATRLAAEYHTVSETFREALGLEIRRGRWFDPGDRNVAIVNAAFERQYARGLPMVGRRLSTDGPDGPWLTVVGVAGNTRHFGQRQDVAPTVLVPYRQDPAPSISVIVRARRAERDTVLADLTRLVARIEPAAALYDVATLDERVSRSLADVRLQAWLAGFAALMALTLAAAGLLATALRAVASRRRELAIRCALGATPRRILRGVVWRALQPVAAGQAGGLVLAAVSHDLLLARAGALAPPAAVGWVLALAGVTAVTLAASIPPARAAARRDPATDLRG
jgi:putative ABC transport system permease protein